MSLVFKLPRYTSQELKSYLGTSGEIVVNSTTNTLTLLDGITPGGTPLESSNRVHTTDYVGPNCRWLFNDNGVIVDVNGRPIREIGYNVMQMLATTAAGGYNYGNYAYREIPIMAMHGVKHIRAMAYHGFWYQDFKSFLDLGDAYWDEFGKMLDLCYNNGIGVQLTLTGMNWQQIPDYVGGYVSDWADPTSATYTLWKEKVLIPVMDRFVDHPAISSWDLFNELNMKVEYKNKPTVNTDAWHNTRAEYNDPRDKITHEQMITMFANASADVRALDPHKRLLVIGNNGRLTSKTDSSQYFWDYCKEINASSDAIVTHQYRGHAGNADWSNIEQELIMLRKIGAEEGKPYILQEVGPGGDTRRGLPYSNRAEQSERICEAIVRSGTQLTFWWWWARGNGSLDVHPVSEDPDADTVKIADYIYRTTRRLRRESYLPVNDITLPQFSQVPRTTTYVESNGNGTIDLDISSLDRNGFGFSFWIKPNSTIEVIGSVISRTNATEEFGGDGTAGITFDIYGGGAWNIRLPAIPNEAFVTGAHKSPMDTSVDWQHVVIQGDFRHAVQEDGRLPLTHGMTVYINGRRVGGIDTPLDFTFSWPDTPLRIFGHSTRTSQNISLKLADLIMFNRPLTDIEVKSLFLQNRKPANSVAAHWKFDSNLVDEINGITGTVNGTITYGSDWTPPAIPF